MAFGIDGKNETKVGWVWDNCNRSTFDVLWSCLSVILVCTYKVIHLNLPSSREAEASWDQLLFWKKWLRKLKWMCFMALSPELLLSMALGDFLWSRQNKQTFTRIRANHNPSLSPSKVEANAIDCVKEEKVTSTERSKSNSLPFLYAQRFPSSGFVWESADLCRSGWTNVHAHFANMYVLTYISLESRSIDKSSRGGFSIKILENTPTEPQARPDSGKQAAPMNNASLDKSDQPYQSLPLFAEQIFMLVEEFSVEIPSLTQEEIRDRSKSDAFTKVFAIGQSAWLIVECIARAAQGLRE